jgi:AraC-like DNA-binding protein
VNKLYFRFGEIDSDRSISALAEVFGTTADNGEIHIPPSIGSGTIKKIQFDKGLVMRVWDFTLHQEFSFHKYAQTVSANEKFFHIGYLLNTDSLTLNNKAFPKAMKMLQGMNIVFFSGDTDMDFEIDPNLGLHAIDISVSYSWLMQAFSDTDTKIKAFITELNEKEYPTMFLESSSAAEYRVVSDIHEAVVDNLKSHLHIKAEAFLLIAEFFRKISSRTSREVLESKILYYDKIMMAEKILDENLQGIFPGIDVIAKKVALSESTLKRYFKVVFNKSLNEHYLEKKMEHAKRLMLEKSITVNEVASILSYEKVSSFIETFKKHHGFSPGQLKRKSA